jgi:hypothetical protein
MTDATEIADALSSLSLAQLDGGEWHAALALDAEACFALTAGLRDVVLLSGKMPDEMGGKPVLLLESTPKNPISTGAQAAPLRAALAAPKRSTSDALVAIGIGELGECKQYSPAQVAALAPLSADGGSRYGVTVRVLGLSPRSQPCPPASRVPDVLELIVVSQAALAATPAPPVTYTIRPADSGSAGARQARHTQNDYIATFVGRQDGLPPALAAFPISTRGGAFELTAHEEDGTLRAAFTSPRPRLTASAIAERLAARIDDPNPPGINEACVVS